jgi:CelD/BcsL family acetyltransferase involved in cellulose biosynthesis
MNSLRTQVLRGPDAWDEVRDAWENLSSSGNTVNHFHLFEWADALGRQFARGPGARWFRAEDEAGPVAVLPFRVERSRPAIARVLTSYPRKADGIMATRADVSAIRTALFADCAATGEPIHVISLNALRTDSTWFKLFSSTAQITPEPVHGGFCAIDTSISSEEWFSSCSRNLRSNLRRAEAKLERQGNCRRVVATDPDEVRAAFDNFVDLEVSGWKGDSGALANRSEQRAMLRQFVTDYARTGNLSLRSLWIDDELAASQISFRFQHRCVLLKLAYDERFSSVAPGNILMADLVTASCEDPAVKVLDLLSAAPWYQRWNADTYPTHQARLFNARTASGLVAGTAWRASELRSHLASRRSARREASQPGTSGESRPADVAPDGN